MILTQKLVTLDRETRIENEVGRNTKTMTVLVLEVQYHLLPQLVKDSLGSLAPLLSKSPLNPARKLTWEQLHSMPRFVFLASVESCVQCCITRFD